MLIKQTILAFTIGAAFLTGPAQAGGPVIAQEEPIVEAEKPRSGWIVPVIVGLVVLCAIACGGEGDDGDRGKPDDPPDDDCKSIAQNGGGC